MEQDVDNQVFGDENVDKPEDIINQMTTDNPPESEQPKESVTGFDELTGEEEQKQPEKVVETPPSFYQSEYQKAKELLKRSDPMLHDQIYGKLKEERKVVQPQEQVPNDVAQDDPGVDPYIAEMRKAMREEWTKLESERQQVNQLQLEQVNAERAFQQFLAESKVTEDQLKDAWGEVSTLGIDYNRPGGANALANVMMKEIQLQAYHKYMNDKAAMAGTDAANKATAIKKVEQPAPGALPEPAKKTKEQKLLESIQSVENNQTHNEVFG